MKWTEKISDIGRLAEGLEIRRGWGVAYYQPAVRMTVVAPIPLNLLIQLGRRVYFAAVRGFKPDDLEKFKQRSADLEAWVVRLQARGSTDLETIMDLRREMDTAVRYLALLKGENQDLLARNAELEVGRILGDECETMDSPEDEDPDEPTPRDS